MTLGSLKISCGHRAEKMQFRFLTQAVRFNETVAVSHSARFGSERHLRSMLTHQNHVNHHAVYYAKQGANLWR